MSLLVSNIVFIWLLPLFIQILIPLAVFVVWPFTKWITAYTARESIVSPEVSRVGLSRS